MAIQIVVPDEVDEALSDRVTQVEEDLVDETIARELGDALAVQRANHEGTQPISTVVGLEEALASNAGPRSHTHNQGPALADWPIAHNLGFRPAGIIVTDSGGTLHRPESIEHVDENNLILHFRFPFGGTAHLS